MIEIRPIREDEHEDAKRVIYRVAHMLFKDPRPLEDSIRFHEDRGELEDMDDIRRNYVDQGGVFLVLLDGGQIIGTGAIRSISGAICELKRLWLLNEYHGRGLGYRMLQELLSFARRAGYERIWLETDSVHQSRAVVFYRRVGFREIPRYSDRIDDDTAMELVL